MIIIRQTESVHLALAIYGTVRPKLISRQWGADDAGDTVSRLILGRIASLTPGKLIFGKAAGRMMDLYAVRQVGAPRPEHQIEFVTVRPNCETRDEYAGVPCRTEVARQTPRPRVFTVRA
jgi:hypothetical protein